MRSYWVCLFFTFSANRPLNRRILSNFKIWLNRGESFPQEILWRPIAKCCFWGSKVAFGGIQLSIISKINRYSTKRSMQWFVHSKAYQNTSRIYFLAVGGWRGVTIFRKCFIFGHICSQQSWFKQLSLTYHCKQIFPSNLFSSLTFIPTLHFTKWRLLQSFKPKWILQEVTQFKGTPKPNTS